MLEWEKIEGDELDDAFEHDNGRLGVLVKRRRRRGEEDNIAGRVNDDFGVESVSTVVGAGNALSGAIARERGIRNFSGHGRNAGGAGSTDAASAASAAAGTSTSSAASTRGTSGWTKLKSR